MVVIAFTHLLSGAMTNVYTFRTALWTRPPFQVTAAFTAGEQVLRTESPRGSLVERSAANGNIIAPSGSAMLRMPVQLR